MALTDLTRISTSGIATGSTIDSPILRKDVSLRGSQVGVTSALFDSSDDALEFNDNVKLKFGNSGDLQLYHDTNHSYIEDTGTGNLFIKSDSVISIRGTTVAIKSADNSQTLIKGVENAGSELYFNNNLKFITTNDGAVVTGILTATGFSGPTNNTSGIATFYDLRVSNNLTVEGTTTTLDTNLIGVDRIEVGANSNTVVGVAITQSGTADILNLYDGSTEVFSVADGGETKFTVGTNKTVKFYAATHNDETSLGAGLGFSRQSDGAELLSGIFGHSNTGLGVAARDHITFLTGGTSNVSDTEERLRITSIGDLLLGNHGSRIFDDSSGTNVVVDIYGGTTAGKRGILALGGRTGSDDADIGTIQFVNENNSVATAANHNQSKLVSSIHVKSETSDGNAGSDSGGHLIFSTKPETGQLTERLRIGSNGQTTISSNQNQPLVLNNTNTNGQSSISFQSAGSTKYNIGSNKESDGSIDFFIYDQVNNKHRFNIKADGNVGIGTDNPSSGKLQVQDGGIAVRGAVTPNINFSPIDGSSGNADISFDGNDLKIISNNSGADIRIAAYSKDNHIVIRPNGRVGIGTDNPTTNLQVNHATNECTISLYNAVTKKAALQTQNSFGTVLYSYDDEPLKFSVASGTSFSEKLNIDSTGEVKIATRNSSNSGEHAFRLGSFGIRTQDTGGFNWWRLEANYGGYAQMIALRADRRIGIYAGNPTSRIDIGYDSNQNGNAFMQFRGPNNKSGEMRHKYVHNGSSSSSNTVNLLEITNFQSPNSHIYGRVTVMGVSPTADYGFKVEGYFYLERGSSNTAGTNAQVGAMELQGGSSQQRGTGSSAQGSLSWSGTTLRYETAPVAYGNMHINVEYHTYDGATVVFDTDSRSF